MPLNNPPEISNPVNLGIVAATTTNANDSIKITGSQAALGNGNILKIPIASTVTAGLVVVLRQTSDVTINLTGAHWGAGTKGDLSGAFLRLYAINDAGTLKYGVGYVGGRFSVQDTSTSATGTSVTSPESLLVNSALTSGTWPCFEIGGFLVNFDDTGGAAEDLWAVQTGINDIRSGQSFNGQWQPFNTTVTGFSAAPTWTTLRWMQMGTGIWLQGVKNAAGTSDATTFTIQSPVKAKSVMNGLTTNIRNNSADAGGAGIAQTVASSATISLYTNNTLAGWTASNEKSASFIIFYEAA